jgi:hypothetical protein
MIKDIIFTFCIFVSIIFVLLGLAWTQTNHEPSEITESQVIEINKVNE